MKKLFSLLLVLVLTVSCLSGLCFAADPEVRWTNGTQTVEGGLFEMVKQASNEGGTLTLLKDAVSYTEKNPVISSNKSLTIDLNGFSVLGPAPGIVISEKADGLTVIKNGTIDTAKMNVWVKGGGLKMENVVCWSDTQQNVSINDATGKWNKENVIENCTFGNPAWGALSFNNTKDSMVRTVVTVRNSTLATTKKSVAVCIQSKAVGGNLVLGEGVKLYTPNGSPVAGAVTVTGEKLTKSEETHEITVLDQNMTGLNLWTTPATATVAWEVPDLTEATAVVASWTDGKTTKEGTLAEVAAYASASGGTIKLIADANYDGAAESPISSDSSFTFDLNGHTFTSEKGGINVSAKAKGITVITDSVGGGAMITKLRNAMVRGGALQVKNVTLWSETMQNIDYYDATGNYNSDNLIEGATIGNPVWGNFSFNSSTVNQEKASMTVRNSTLVAAKAAGGNCFVLQVKPEGSTATIVLGEGVKCYTYATGDNGYVHNALKVTGEPATKAEGTHSVTVADKSFDMMTLWTTPEVATVTKPVETPAEKPAETPTVEKPAEQKPAEQKPEEKPAVTPAESKGAPVGLIIGIVAAVVVIAAVVVVVLKKKKK